MVEFEETVQSLVSAYNKTSAKFRFLWTISDYLKVKNEVKHNEFILQKTEVNIIPQTFACKMKLYPNGDNRSDDKHVSVFLRKVAPTRGAFISYELSVLDGKGMKRFLQSVKERSVINNGWGRHNWFPLDIPEEKHEVIFPNGCLQILVEGTAWAGEPIVKNTQTKANKENITSEIPLFESEEHSDIAVHKSILSTKSSVFKKIFEESSQNIIVIPGVDPNVFRVVLYFIYNNMLTANAKTMLPDILTFAHRYKLHYLKEIVQLELAERITVDNSVDYLLAAEKCEAPILKEKVLEFISENKKDISAKHSQEVFKQLPQDLLVEAYSRLLNQD